MHKLHIVTDSTADLPETLVREYDITVVPLHVIFGSGESYLDGVEISTAEFYRRQKQSKELSSTSQPTPVEFAAVYQKLGGPGKSIISIHISSAMSGTVQSANLASRMADGADIEVIDSRVVSMGLGIIVLEAAKCVREGKSKQEVIGAIRKMIEKMEIFFVVETLEYLARGGRIGKAQAFIGTILNVRPILTIKEGIVHPYEKVRGKTRSIDRLVQLVSERAAQKPVICSFIHSADPAGLEELRTKATAKLNLLHPPIESELGAVVGTHAGPGVLGAMFLSV
ncbi:MAG: DegV family protein [Desulfotomaculum sp. 46_296]|nr:MAG: DegV family protein [Desulfotomaculum sp. 46_296]HAU31007.1 DegV family protein [Desulfotomaculum sp.]